MVLSPVTHIFVHKSIFPDFQTFHPATPRDENIPNFILKVKQRRHLICSIKRNREDIYQISNHAFQGHYELESAIEKNFKHK